MQTWTDLRLFVVICGVLRCFAVICGVYTDLRSVAASLKSLELICGELQWFATWFAVFRQSLQHVVGGHDLWAALKCSYVYVRCKGDPARHFGGPTLHPICLIPLFPPIPFPILYPLLKLYPVYRYLTVPLLYFTVFFISVSCPLFTSCPLMPNPWNLGRGSGKWVKFHSSTLLFS